MIESSRLLCSESLSAIGISDVRRHLADNGRSVRIGNGRQHRAVGRYASMKTGMSHPWESRLELHDMYRAEVDVAVLSYVTQPETLTWRHAGCDYRYTPDRVDVLACGVRRYIEVKDSLSTESTEYLEKLSQAATIYSLCGCEFVVRERAQIYSEPSFTAVEEIQAFKRACFSTRELSVIFAALARTALTLGELKHRLRGDHVTPMLYAMMVQRIVDINLTAGVSDDARVSLVGTDAC